MIWLADIRESLTFGQVAFGIGLFLTSLVISVGATALVLVKVPPDYFSLTRKREFLPGRPWHLRWGAIVAKNILGLVLVVIGILLSLPGIPGQGILTILLGLILLDIPGKRPLETRIIRRPAILRVVNKLRSRYGRPPLQLDQE
ncbi:MAG: hypothetical protein ABI878_03930 [Acidobacteriota bacterium]